jgi:hypothetical protein
MLEEEVVEEDFTLPHSQFKDMAIPQECMANVSLD